MSFIASRAILPVVLDTAAASSILVNNLISSADLLPNVKPCAASLKKFVFFASASADSLAPTSTASLPSNLPKPAPIFAKVGANNAAPSPPPGAVAAVIKISAAISNDSAANVPNINPLLPINSDTLPFENILS